MGVPTARLHLAHVVFEQENQQLAAGEMSDCLQNHIGLYIVPSAQC